MTGIAPTAPALPAPRAGLSAASPTDPAATAFVLCAGLCAEEGPSAEGEPSLPAAPEESLDNPLAGLLAMLNLALPKVAEPLPPGGAALPATETATATAVEGGGLAALPEQPAESSILVAALPSGLPTQGGIAAAAAILPSPVPTQMPMPASVAPAAPPLSPQQPDFADALGEQIGWIVGEERSEASIELHPPELGPIRIRIEHRGDQSSLLFQATHPQTRDLLAASLPQLRDLLNAQGIELARAQVSAPAARRDELPRVTPERERGEPPPRRRQWHLGLIDRYA
jgi:flagellar hook-length control protein FliK